MTYTKEQTEKIRANIKKIVDYIESNILPHITYVYETGAGISKYYIGLNGPYADQIRFYCGNSWYNADDLSPDDAVMFLTNWQDDKSYMWNEILRTQRMTDLINNFEV